MKYDTCRRCPLNIKCEKLYKGDNDAENLQDVWSGRGRSHMSTQKKQNKDRQQRKRQVQANKTVDKQKHRDKAKR